MGGGGKRKREVRERKAEKEEVGEWRKGKNEEGRGLQVTSAGKGKRV